MVNIINKLQSYYKTKISYKSDKKYNFDGLKL